MDNDEKKKLCMINWLSKSLKATKIKDTKY